MFIILGVIGAVFAYLSSESQNQERDFFIEAQATLLAQHGLGNIYTQAFKDKILRTGSIKSGIQLLHKALEVNPNDIEALAFFASLLSLQLSFLKWLRKTIDSKKSNEELFLVKKLAQKGNYLAPTNHVFLDVLGILSDLEGKHSNARKFFKKSSHFRNDPYWRLLMATSWHMSGKHHQALHELQCSEKEGAKGWFFDFYYGRALNAVGDDMQAIVYLKSAYKKRGRRPELLNELSASYHNSGSYFRSAGYCFLLAMTVIPNHLGSAVRDLLKGLADIVIGLVCLASKTCWKVIRFIPLVRQLQLRFIPPDELEFTLGNLQMEKGNYKAAEHHFRLSCSIVQTKAENHANLAVCLALQGRTGDALDECDKAIKIKPKDEMLIHSRKQIAAGNFKRIVDQHGKVIRSI